MLPLWPAAALGFLACGGAPEAHIGLAQMYETTPEFQARYETIAKGFTAYFCAAMRVPAA